MLLSSKLSVFQHGVLKQRQKGDATTQRALDHDEVLAPWADETGKKLRYFQALLLDPKACKRKSNVATFTT